jgi:predicted TIM-barrel fold metal-dependent hydrolase
MSNPPEYNVTSRDYSLRDHLVSLDFPIIDFHAHVTTTHVSDKPEGPAGGHGSAGTTHQAELMLRIGEEFGVVQTLTMCPAQDILPLRERFGDRLKFNAMINKKPEEPEDAAYRNLDEFLEQGISAVKLWSAPRGRDRGLVVDAPWRKEALRRASKAGIRLVMVHVGDPDRWWQTAYQDTAKFGTKLDQYRPLREMMELFPDLIWIGAHMGGDPEHPDHLEELLERYPQYHLDTSATKWQVREVSPRAEAIRSLVCRHPDRFLFGTDLVTRNMLVEEHYVSRYWCQRTLWESAWQGRSPISDPDFVPVDQQATPWLRGVSLPREVLRKVYFENARRLLSR